MATIYDIAKVCNISATTVSRALKEDKRISEETRKLVQETAKKLNYQANAIAKSLKTGKSNTIGVITNDLATFAVPSIIDGIEEIANNNNYNVILCNTSGKRAKEDRYIRVLREKQVEGIIFVGTWIEVDRHCNYLDIGVPFVAINRDYKDHNVCTINHDDVQVAYIATEYLISKKRERIALINGPMDLVSPPGREKGFRQAVKDHNIELRQEWISSGPWHFDNGYKHTLEMVKDSIIPDAIVAGDDLIAIGAIKALEETGFKVPGDILVIGCDDREIASNYLPRLTTVKLPLFEMGARAAESLLIQINKSGRLKSHKLKSEIIIRDSA